MLTNKHIDELVANPDTQYIQLFYDDGISGMYGEDQAKTIADMIDDDGDPVFDDMHHVETFRSLFKTAAGVTIKIGYKTVPEDWPVDSGYWSVELEDPSYVPAEFGKLSNSGIDLTHVIDGLVERIKAKYRL